MLARYFRRWSSSWLGIAAAAIALAIGAAIVAPPAMAAPALVFEVAEGKVLYAEDLDLQWSPASLAKIMTAYLVFDAIKKGALTPDSKITYSDQADAQVPSKLGLPIGAQLSVETALQALIIKSANDVAVMLAEGVAGSHDAFVARMNATAARLGMTRTKFANANGLPSVGQVTTARDLGRLARAVVRDYPEHASLWSTAGVKIGNSHLRSYNGLLRRYAGADGLKTGFTCDSGFNIIGSATRNGHKLIAVALGATTDGERSLRAANLLEHGFRKLGWAQLFPTYSIESLPMEIELKGPMTMRQTSPSWVCDAPAAALAKAKGKDTAVTARAPATSGRWPPW
jgi:D-alanyl-D-alanine carboxypeptidase